MATEADDGTLLAPDEAFAALGNETRMELLQTLAEADVPLSFSALRERVGVSDSGQFNYHLGKLDDHFIEDTADGYRLQPAGKRVIEAVLSGAVTEAPTFEPTEIDRLCGYCGAPIEVTFRMDWVAMRCTECAGAYDPANATHDTALEHGYLGGFALPPAGTSGRTAAEVLKAGEIWGALEIMATAGGICPRCSARVEDSLTVCEDHDAAEGLCDACGHLKAVHVLTTCTNCIYARGGWAALGLATTTELLDFETDHDLNPIVPSDEFYEMIWNYDEEVLATDPIEARFTFTYGGDSLSLTVDDELRVVDVAAGGEPAGG